MTNDRETKFLSDELHELAGGVPTRGGSAARDRARRGIARHQRNRRAAVGAATGVVVLAALFVVVDRAPSRATPPAATNPAASTTTPTSRPTTPNTSSPSAPTPTTATPAAWTAQELTITPTSLGAVAVGMSQTEAQTAAGITFDGSGDGFVYPTKLPTGFPHDYVGLRISSVIVTCVGAEIFPTTSPTAQTVTTPEGFRLGDSVAHLLAVYGSRARYVAAPASGMTTNAGYVVKESVGNLVFVVGGSPQRIVEIAGGSATLGPNSCTG
jgi:hypothetical protein